MIYSGTKTTKNPLAKFKQNRDMETVKQFRKKHEDKESYRILRDEKKNVS